MELEFKSELQAKLVEYMTSVEDGVVSLIDFGSEQAPILVQEILAFSLIEHGIFVGIDLAVFCICVFLFKKTLPYLAGCLEDDNVFPVIGLVLSGLFGIITFTTMIKGVLTCAKIQFAPRLFMLEYIKDLIQ
tara:strand:+ start:2952 stop:3347 length:396 start_codon:yes stop_codon:yes gene_type:complete